MSRPGGLGTAGFVSPPGRQPVGDPEDRGRTGAAIRTPAYSAPGTVELSPIGGRLLSPETRAGPATKSPSGGGSSHPILRLHGVWTGRPFTATGPPPAQPLPRCEVPDFNHVRLVPPRAGTFSFTLHLHDSKKNWASGR
jgi:hypothetical protein